MRNPRHVVLRLPAVAYMVFIFYMSSGPIESDSLQSFPDYILHSAGDALLYLLVHVAFHGSFRPARGRGGYLLPLLITALYGLSDEIHQSFVPTREASFRDLVADIGGGVIGVAISLVLRRVPYLQQLFDYFDTPGKPAVGSTDA